MFTLNNYTEETYSSLLSLLRSNTKYWIVGKEVAPTTGTPHLQGYVEFNVQRTVNSVIKSFKGCHVEIRRGTREQARDYCAKGGDFEEHQDGFQPQGTRTDLKQNFTTMREAVIEADSYQAIKKAECYLTWHEEKRDWKPEVHWFYGETGTGKSRKARYILGDDVYTKNEASKWWNGYDGHADVIIDDFRDSWWSLTEMLRLLDRYECKIETKGGMRQFRPRRIIVTSAIAPSACYQNTGESIKQLIRRIDRVEQFTALNAWTPPCEDASEAVLLRTPPPPGLSQTQLWSLPATPRPVRRLLCLDPLPPLELEGWPRVDPMYELGPEQTELLNGLITP